MSRVTEYKVCKAIENGVPVDEQALVIATQRPQHEVLAVLVKLYPDQFGTPGLNVPYRTEATIDELVKYVRDWYARDGIDAILSYEFWPAACGCLGPQRGEPLCPCSMRAALYRNKAAVAARLMEEPS